MSERKAQLTIDGVPEAIELPVYEGSVGPDVVDVRSLVSKGIFTYDPGFVSTASGDSDITYIDGGAGVLPQEPHVVRIGGGDDDRNAGLIQERCVLPFSSVTS